MEVPQPLPPPSLAEASYAAQGVEAICPICYEEFNEESTKRRVLVDGCNHAFCHACLAHHIKLAVTWRNIPIPCPQVEEKEEKIPAQSHCLTPELLERILTEQSSCKTSKNETPVPTNVQTTQVVDTGSVDDLEKGHPAVELTRTFSTASSSCSAKSSSSSLSSTTSISSLPGYWNKYLRFLQHKENPKLLSCPNCEELIPPPIDVKEDEERNLEVVDNTHTIATIQGEEEDDNPDMENPEHHLTENNSSKYFSHEVFCPSCRHAFCALHGDAHSGLTCLEFSLTKQARASQLSEQAILEMSKRCSHGCGARIVRVSGCDHIICGVCHQDMCYRCGTHQFLSGKVIRSCSRCRQGYVDHRYYGQYRLRLLLILPFHLVLTALYMALVGAIAVLTFGFGCCFACGSRGRYCEPAGVMRPRKGIVMAAQVVCLPMIELMADCGFIPHNDNE